jgi:hypothetical protein
LFQPGVMSKHTHTPTTIALDQLHGHPKAQLERIQHTQVDFVADGMFKTRANPKECRTYRIVLFKPFVRAGDFGVAAV